VKRIDIDFRAAYDELQGLDWKNPGAWSQWIYYFVCALVAFLLLGAGYYFGFAPRYGELQQARRQELQLRHEFETKQRKVASLDALKQQLETMKHDFGDMLKQLPSKAEVANLLNDISQARIAAGLNEELFQPLPEQPKDFYAIIPNRIVVTGHYHQMGDFVSAVAALPRIVTIDEVQISSAGGKAGSGVLRMSALAKTYRYLDETATVKKKPGRRR